MLSQSDASTDAAAKLVDAAYHPRSKRRLYLHVCISEEDRAALARLTHARKLSGSEVVRLLIAEEDARHSSPSNGGSK